MAEATSTDINTLTNPPEPIKLPDPTVPTPVPAPTVPTVDQITPDVKANTPPTDTQNTQSTILQKLQEKLGILPTEAPYRASAEADAGIADKQKTYQTYLDQLNGLQTNAQQIPLQIQNDFQGRGATEGGVSSIQSAQLRNNSIQQLGLSAKLAAAKGDLTLAQDQVDKMVAAKFDPLKAEIDGYTKTLAALEPTLNREQQAQLATQRAALDERSNMIAQQEAETKSIHDVMLQAAQSGADAKTLNAISDAKTFGEAVSLASSSLGAKFDSDQARQALQDKLTNAQISKIYSDISQNNPTTLSTADDITSILKNNKVGQATKTGLSLLLGVMNSAEDMAKANPSGNFAGISPLNSFLDANVKGIGLPFRNALRGKDNIVNSGYIEGINLKVQQWASGAALTDSQTAQVNKMVPTTNDTDTVVKTKLNNIYNYMQTQAKSELQSEGINYSPPQKDLFAPQTLDGIFSQ